MVRPDGAMVAQEIPDLKVVGSSPASVIFKLFNFLSMKTKTEKLKETHKTKVFLKRLTVAGYHLSKLTKLMKESFANLANNVGPTEKQNLQVKDLYKLTHELTKKKDKFVPRSSFYYFVKNELKNKSNTEETLTKKCLEEFENLTKFQKKILKKELKNKLN